MSTFMTIVSMAHHMHMKVTAEGVETEAQVALLNELGCDQMQGYYYGKPMPADRVAAELLSQYKTWAVEAGPDGSPARPHTAER